MLLEVSEVEEDLPMVSEVEEDLPDEITNVVELEGKNSLMSLHAMSGLTAKKVQNHGRHYVCQKETSLYLYKRW